jgi:hypothetical protein
MDFAHLRTRLVILPNGYFKLSTIKIGWVLRDLSSSTNRHRRTPWLHKPSKKAEGQADFQKTEGQRPSRISKDRKLKAKQSFRRPKAKQSFRRPKAKQSFRRPKTEDRRPSKVSEGQRPAFFLERPEKKAGLRASMDKTNFPLLNILNNLKFPLKGGVAHSSKNFVKQYTCS